MSPASPQVAREPIRAAQYDDDASDEDSPGDITTPSKRSLVGKPTAARSTHRRLASDSPLLGSPRPRRTPPTAAEAKAAEDEEEEEASGSPSWRARTRALRDRNVGVLLIACSQVWFALMAACVALMTQTDDASVPTWELIFSRMGIVRSPCLPDPSRSVAGRPASAATSRYGSSAIQIPSSARPVSGGCWSQEGQSASGGSLVFVRDRYDARTKLKADAAQTSVYATFR
jgi:hypothetical protein